MTVNEVLTFGVALLSLVVSGVTAWLTLAHPGRVKMTRPTIVAFAFEGASPKVFLRFLLYSTAQRGNVIESMHVILVQGEKRHIYTFWGYGDTPQGLVRGSGLFVSREGVAINHHFVSPKGELVLPLEARNCDINVYATILGQRGDQLLQSVHLNIDRREVDAINNPKARTIYDWNPDSRQYRAESA